MNDIKKCLKIAKDIVIEPADDIESKIVNKISNISKSDSKLLDKEFLDYVKKSNSRIYLLCEKIRNNPGKFTVLGLVALITIIFTAIIVKEIFNKEISPKKNVYLSSSKNNSKN